MPEKTTTASYGSAALILWLAQLDWTTISMAGGLLLGIITCGVNWYYRKQAHKVYMESAKRAAEKGIVINEPKF